MIQDVLLLIVSVGVFTLIMLDIVDSYRLNQELNALRSVRILKEHTK